MKKFKFRIIDQNGKAKSAFSRQFNSLKACVSAVQVLQLQDIDAFCTKDDRIEIVEVPAEIEIAA